MMFFFKNKFKTNQFFLGNYLTSISQNKIRELCDKIIKSGEKLLLFGNLSWEEDEETIRMLKMAGFVYTIIDTCKFTDSQNKKLIILIKNRIFSKIKLCIGNPNETEADFYEIFKNLKNFLSGLEKGLIKQIKIVPYNFSLFDNFEQFSNTRFITWNEFNNNLEVYKDFSEVIKTTKTIVKYQNLSNGEILHRLLLIKQMIKKFSFAE